MKLVRLFGMLSAVLGAASWLDARAARRRALRSQDEKLEKTRWESEGGAIASGPHVSDAMPGVTAACPASQASTSAR